MASTLHHPPRRLRPRAWALLALAPALAAQAAGVPDRVYVSNEKDHRLQVFNTQGDRLGEIAVCQRPRHMMFLPGHAQLIVSCGDSDQLGIVDVAFRDPVNARSDYRHMWGVDDLSCLSRYDGLRYIRLTRLGAYILGLADAYRPAETKPSAALSVLPSRMRARTSAN